MKPKPLHTLAGLLCLLLFTGCQSANQPGSASHAVVQINGRSLAEIQRTTSVVFGEESYSLGTTSPEMMIFERPGSRRDAAKYGGWYGEGVIMRVKVGFRELAGGSYLLQADAYAGQNSDDAFFRSEDRALMLNRRPYQRLLDEVAKRLK
jgi:hypothetical protein